jgi:23S rRNA pseudouridine1911/1915/1917 synthase
VNGVVRFDNGVVDLPIGRSVSDRKRMAVRFEKSKAAKTTYKVLERFRDYTLLELELATGRTHQIRVHLSYLGHPIIGDEKYGTKGAFPRPALHAKTLGFMHPVTKRYLEFTTELPNDMAALKHP